MLESRGEPAATVLGTFGVERHLAVFTGQTAHAGATPMPMRRDTFMATAQAALAIREVGFDHDGRLHRRRSDERARRGDRGARTHGDAAGPAPPRPGRAGGDARRGPRRLRAGRGGSRLRGRVAAPLVDPADPVRRAPDRLRAPGGPGRRRQGHRDPERAAPRRRRDGTADPDCDAVLVVLPAGFAHEGGGHARGRPPRG